MLKSPCNTNRSGRVRFKQEREEPQLSGCRHHSLLVWSTLHWGNKQEGPRYQEGIELPKQDSGEKAHCNVEKNNEGSKRSWLSWKEETTLGRKKDLGLKTTLSLCNTGKSFIENKTTNSETIHTMVIAMRKSTMGVWSDNGISPTGSKESLWMFRKTRFSSHGDEGEHTEGERCVTPCTKGLKQGSERPRVSNKNVWDLPFYSTPSQMRIQTRQEEGQYTSHVLFFLTRTKQISNLICARCNGRVCEKSISLPSEGKGWQSPLDLCLLGQWLQQPGH